MIHSLLFSSGKINQEKKFEKQKWTTETMVNSNIENKKLKKLKKKNIDFEL